MPKGFYCTRRSRLSYVARTSRSRRGLKSRYTSPTWPPGRGGYPSLIIILYVLEPAYIRFRRIWLFDLAKSPEVSGLDIQYRGLDISRASFPHSAWLPKNIVLSTSNLLEEPPESLHGQFDVVHVRLVLSLIGSGSPKPIIRHIKMLLSLYLPALRLNRVETSETRLIDEQSLVATCSGTRVSNPRGYVSSCLGGY